VEFFSPEGLGKKDLFNYHMIEKIPEEDKLSFGER